MIMEGRNLPNRSFHLFKNLLTKIAKMKGKKVRNNKKKATLCSLKWRGSWETRRKLLWSLVILYYITEWNVSGRCLVDIIRGKLKLSYYYLVGWSVFVFISRTFMIVVASKSNSYCYTYFVYLLANQIHIIVA